MKDNYAHICLILDRSGSMQLQFDETITGVNSFIKSQQEAPGEATMTLVQFDDYYEQVYSFVPIPEVPLLTRETFIPRGWTALLDAIGRAMENTGKVLAEMKEEDRPSKVIIAVVTDGAENASKCFTQVQIQDMIKHQQDVYSWQIAFLSSDIKAVQQAHTLGFATDNVRVSRSVNDAMDLYSKSITRYRGSASAAPGNLFDSN